MAGIFAKRIWQPCICQPNELKREIKKKLGGPKGGQAKSGGGHGPPRPPLESPLLQGGTSIGLLLSVCLHKNIYIAMFFTYRVLLINS